MIAIIGLGNPGVKFKKTWHNLGFLVVDEFQKKNNFPHFRFLKKLNALISEGKLNEKKVILAKPQTFMNNSGRAVKLLIANYQLPIAKLFIIHDDFDFPLGKIKIVKNRGSAGHKGVESIIRELKTKDFVRFRIGINPFDQNQKLEEFVLKSFSKKEEKIVREVIKKTTEAIEVAIKKGVDKAMQEYNR